MSFPARWVVSPMGVEPGRMNDAGEPLPKEADMPNGIYPVPPFHQQRASRSVAPSLWQRLKTWRERDRLDEQLAQGGDREAIAELRLRAAQLVSPTGRVELAIGVERAVREARGRQAAVRACAEDLLALAQRLRDERPIDVRGAAMTRRLLTDRATSPLYRADAESSLKEAVRSARLALDPFEPGEASFPPAA
jgi:hypothetical protein